VRAPSQLAAENERLRALLDLQARAAGAVRVAAELLYEAR
jgi:hypothetical protein